MLRFSRSLRHQATAAEIQIPFPWGHIAAKKWNRLPTPPPQEAPKIATEQTQTVDKTLPFLCFHGWLDNAGTFDRLIPLLQAKHPDAEFICVDFPGHGRSSHRPDGTHSNSSVYVYDIARIVEELDLKESGFNVIGHSLGGNAVTQYSCIFPGQIKSMVVLDTSGFMNPISNMANYSVRVAKSVESALRMDKNIDRIKSKKFTYDQAVERFKGGSGMLPQHSVEPHVIDTMLKRALIERGSNENDEKLYSWARDPKVFVDTPITYTQEAIEQLLAHRNSVPELLPNQMNLIASQSNYGPVILKMTPEDLRKTLVETEVEKYGDLLKNPNLRIHLVEGNHHFHLNNPDEAATRINDFITGAPEPSTFNFEDYIRKIRFP